MPGKQAATATWVIVNENYRASASCEFRPAFGEVVEAFQQLGWKQRTQAYEVLDVTFGDLRDLDRVDGAALHETFHHFETPMTVAQHRSALRRLIHRLAGKGERMPDLGEAAQQLPAVGRVSIDTLRLELVQGDETMAVEVADVRQPLAKLWVRYAAPDMKATVPLGRGSWAGPSVVVDTGDLLIRSTRAPATPHDKAPARTTARTREATRASERLVRSLGA